MSDIRDLRLALKKKLDQRRELLTDNARLRSSLARTERQRDFLLDAAKSPLFDALMECMADEIANAVIEEALKASEVVANETHDSRGTWEIGISIPSLHIRRMLRKEDIREIRDEAIQAIRGEPIRRVEHRGGNQGEAKA